MKHRFGSWLAVLLCNVAAHSLPLSALCLGDCNGDGHVTVDELAAGIAIGLGAAPRERCAAADRNDDGTVSIDETITAVLTGVRGCDQPLPVCGDGVTDGGEECDDGNRSGGDGCSADCKLEPGGDLCTGIIRHNAQHLASVPVATGLSQPLYVTAPPRDVSRVFIVEQTGRIRIVKHGVLLSAAFLDLTARVSCCRERGLLSMAFHPDYANNGRFFVDYTDTNGNSVVAGYRVSSDPDLADPDSAAVILRQDQPFPNHNGGLVLFGPDRNLYIGFGDGGSAGDPFNNAQNLGTWLGKILRIDVDGGMPYAVPAGNPFVGQASTLPEIWAFGLRNPWRFSFDRATGDLYIGDVGQDLFEEVDVQPAGHGGNNYGWRIMEGRHCFNPADNCPMDGLTLPVLEYEHDDACSITGGFAYRGCAMPSLRGTYFYADYCADVVRSFVYRDGTISNEHDWTGDLTPPGGGSIEQISSFGEDARGELYICDLRGSVYRVVPGS